MSRICTVLILFLYLLIQPDIISSKEKRTTVPLKRVEVLTVGSIVCPIGVEERSDIPFKLLVDEEFRRIMSDSIDYENYRPTLVFLEKGFEVLNSTDKKRSFGSISVTVLSGKYRFPKEMSDIQKAKIENNIKMEVDSNLINTQFRVKRWNPFEFKKINELTAIQYSYEQTLNGKNPTRIITTNLYDSDVQLQIVLSAPQKEYKRWLSYYNQLLETFQRKINIADIATFEYQTHIQDRKDIQFKFLIDNEFKKVLGDSVNYEKFRPDLLFLDRNFTITDSTNVAPFGSISFSLIPQHNARVLKADSLNAELLQENMKKSVEENLASTDYKIKSWGDFKVSELQGLPAFQYSYEQQLKDKEPLKVYATYIFDKSEQIQLTMSSPLSSLPEWKNNYDNILASYQRLIKIPNSGGTMFYPTSLEERSDIPFAKLVDKESKKKFGDSIDYERFRPESVFLKRNFNENDSTDLETFSSITISTKKGDFTKYSNLDSLKIEDLEAEIKANVERNLQNTGYRVTNWDSFKSSKDNGVRTVSHAYTQQLDGSGSKYIAVTSFYTKKQRIQVILTASENEYPLWKAEYDRMVNSYRLSGWR